MVKISKERDIYKINRLIKTKINTIFNKIIKSRFSKMVNLTIIIEIFLIFLSIVGINLIIKGAVAKEEIDKSNDIVSEIIDEYENSIDDKRYGIREMYSNQYGSTVVQEYNNTYNKYLEDCLQDKSFTNNYDGCIDCILDIPDINIYGPVIALGNQEYNLSKYLFVTGQNDMLYGYGDYLIMGHQSKVYEHSFNRLDEVVVGDRIYVHKDDIIDEYIVEKVGLEVNTSSVVYTYGNNTKGDLIILTCTKGHKQNKPLISIRAKLVLK